MTRLHFDQDIQPLSDFRAGAASFIRQINETRRPIVITQRGKGVAVVVDVAEYESMQEKIELLEEVQKAEAQLSAGLGISNSDARAQILKSINPWELSGSNYREVIFGSYRIIYKVENEVKILTLRNSRQLLSLDDIEL